MFQFNFGDDIQTEKQVKLEPKRQAERVVANPSIDTIRAEIIKIGSVRLAKRCFYDVKLQLASSEDKASHLVWDKNDVVAGVYEGGFKTWECSLDLVSWLSEQPRTFFEKQVMELGCGSALPGIYCQKRGAQVDFQDYNASVLENITIPNVILNMSKHLIENEDDEFEVNIHSQEPLGCFYGGDWANIHQTITKKYDMILTSETIYETNNLPSLVHLIKELLQPKGIVLVAAKSNYFGCSGSLSQFLTVYEQIIPNCTFETVFVDTSSVRREIIKVQHP